MVGTLPEFAARSFMPPTDLSIHTVYSSNSFHFIRPFIECSRLRSSVAYERPTSDNSESQNARTIIAASRKLR